MTLADFLLGAEVVVFIVFGLPLSVRGTIRLISAIRSSTSDDRLARAITLYLTLVSFTAIYLLVLTGLRLLVDSDSLIWLRPVTGALALAIMVGPWWIERSTRDG